MGATYLEFPMSQTFSVTPPPSHAAWLLGGLLSIPVVIIAIAMGTSSWSPKHATDMPGLASGLLVVAAVAGFTFWGLGRRAVELDARQLRVKAAMFAHHVDASDLDMDRARVVDLDERTELRPALKTFGMALPGFQAGWFLLRDRSRAFCLLTARRRVLWLPTRTGKAFMLSLERPEALLEALRQMSTSPAGRRA